MNQVADRVHTEVYRVHIRREEGNKDSNAYRVHIETKENLVMEVLTAVGKP